MLKTKFLLNSKIGKFFLATVFLTFQLNSLALATPAGTSVTGLKPVPFPLVEYTKKIFLIIVILAIFLVLIKFFLAPRIHNRQIGGMKILDRLFLEPQVSLYLVKVGPKVVLLSVNKKETVLVADDLVFQDFQDLLKNIPPKSGFSEILTQVLPNNLARKEA